MLLSQLSMERWLAGSQKETGVGPLAREDARTEWRRTPVESVDRPLAGVLASLDVRTCAIISAQQAPGTARAEKNDTGNMMAG